MVLGKPSLIIFIPLLFMIDYSSYTRKEGCTGPYGYREWEVSMLSNTNRCLARPWMQEYGRGRVSTHLTHGGPGQGSNMLFLRLEIIIQIVIVGA